MEINDLHQILAELESNLKDLESARKQVENVTEKSDNVNNSTKELIGKLETFIKVVKKDRKGYTDDFSQILSDFKTDLEDFFNSTKEKTEKENKRIRELTTAFINAINEIFDDFNYKSERSFDDFIRILENTSSSFEEKTKKQVLILKEVGNSIQNLIEEQKTEFQSLKQEFINECKKQNKINMYLLIGIIILAISNIVLHFLK